jgi:hypothetical protein
MARMKLSSLRITTAILFFLLTGCTLSRIIPTISPQATQENVDVWLDSSYIVSGLCFESAFDAAGQVFVIKNEAELTGFFNLADNSGLCRRPVRRQTFDFSSGRVLVGLWSKGRGCKAQHDVTYTEQSGETFTMHLKFVTEGACNYELVRPFWIAILRDYELSLVIE